MKVAVVAKSDEGEVRKIGEVAISGKAETLARSTDVVLALAEKDGEPVFLMLRRDEVLLKAAKDALDAFAP
jgi:hypothetical protein